MKLVFWIAREACGSKRPVFDILRSGISETCLPTRPCIDAECVDAWPNRDVEGGKERNVFLEVYSHIDVVLKTMFYIDYVASAMN